MSANPFTADPSRRCRMGELTAEFGPRVRVAAHRGKPGDNLGAVLSAEDVAALVDVFGLDGPRELMLLGLDAATRLARPPISEFFVGAIGLEAETGNLVLGGNVEFPGTHLGLSVHGEGFVFTRAFSRGATISVLALGEAHPCAHCRQYLSEFRASRDLQLIDPVGHTLTMAELYPWPFDPAYLGESGVMPGRVSFPNLIFAGRAKSDVADRLLEAGRKAYAPYSKCPSAIVLELGDGQTVAGAAIESVAFNPSMGPLQAALIDLIAHGYDYGDIRRAILGTTFDGAVDYRRSTAELLAAVAPEAELTVLDWRP